MLRARTACRHAQNDEEGRMRNEEKGMRKGIRTRVLSSTDLSLFVCPRSDAAEGADGGPL